MNIYIIGCFALTLLILSLLPIITWSINNNKKGTSKTTVCLATIFSVFLLITAPIALNGKFKADKLYDDYVELLSRINNSDDLTDVEKLQLNMEIDGNLISMRIDLTTSFLQWEIYMSSTI